MDYKTILKNRSNIGDSVVRLIFRCPSVLKTIDFDNLNVSEMDFLIQVFEDAISREKERITSLLL